jgi:hypothetical protein
VCNLLQSSRFIFWALMFQNGQWAADICDITVEFNLFLRQLILYVHLFQNVCIIFLTDTCHRIGRTARKTRKPRVTRTGWTAWNQRSQRHPWLTRTTSTEVRSSTGRLSFSLVFIKFTCSAQHPKKKFSIQIYPIQFISPQFLCDTFQE